MVPRMPVPYRTTTYTFPAAPLHYAKRIVTPDGADLATFVYGPEEATLEELLADSPVLALHGNGGSHATFAAVIDRLCAAGKGVVTFDGRAQGQSGRGTLPLTYELFASDALCVLDALGVDKVHVVGHSDGGIEALLLARDHADRILSIVAGGANLTPEGVIEDPSWDTTGSAATNQAWATFMEASSLPVEIDSTLLPQAEPHVRSCGRARLHRLGGDRGHRLCHSRISAGRGARSGTQSSAPGTRQRRMPGPHQYRSYSQGWIAKGSRPCFAL